MNFVEYESCGRKKMLWLRVEKTEILNELWHQEIWTRSIPEANADKAT